MFNSEGEKRIGLYIHVPFCKSRCYYCDFNSSSGCEELIPDYFKALKHEIKLYGSKIKGRTVRSIFIGGGTPSLVEPGYIYEILNTARQYFEIERNSEITIESNPGTLSYEKLASYRAIGINRISIGLQAWQNSLLKTIGRIHTRNDFTENYKQARKAGFKNINIDLIFGLPEQSLRQWEDTLDRVIELDPQHISCYSLKIEEGTVFGSRYEAGEIKQIEDEVDREMYYMAVEKLENAGLKHYEISNFSKPGFECRHNMIYWKAEEYLGAGAGSHSYLDSERYNNIYSITRYIDSLKSNILPLENKEIIQTKDSMSEYIILGLRLIDGIDLEMFREKYGLDLVELHGPKIEELEKKNLIMIEDNRLKLTKKGLDLANGVMMEFL